MANKSTVSKHAIATILVYALYNTDAQAAKDFGVSTRTILRYRAKIEKDPELAEIVGRKREQAEAEWIDAGKDTMLSAIAFIRRCALQLKPSADNAYAVAGALKIVSEVTATHKLIDLRIENARRDSILGNSGQDNRTLAAPAIIVQSSDE